MAEGSSPARRDVSKPVIKIISDWLCTDSSYEASSRNIKKCLEEREAERVKEAQEAEQRLKKELEKQVEDKVKSVIDEHLSSWKKKQEAGQRSQQKKAQDAAVAAAVEKAKEAVGLKDTAQRIADLESQVKLLRQKDRLVSDCAAKFAALSMGKEVEGAPEARKGAQTRETGEMDVVDNQGLTKNPEKEAPGSAGPVGGASDEDMEGDEMLEGLEARAEAMEREAGVDEPSSAAKRKKSSQPDSPKEAGTILAPLERALAAAVAWGRLAVIVEAASVVMLGSSTPDFQAPDLKCHWLAGYALVTEPSINYPVEAR
jgi:hypothetical protein